MLGFVNEHEINQGLGGIGKSVRPALQAGGLGQEVGGHLSERGFNLRVTVGIERQECFFGAIAGGVIYGGGAFIVDGGVDCEGGVIDALTLCERKDGGVIENQMRERPGGMVDDARGLTGHKRRIGIREKGACNGVVFTPACEKKIADGSHVEAFVRADLDAWTDPGLWLVRYVCSATALLKDSSLAA